MATKHHLPIGLALILWVSVMILGCSEPEMSQLEPMQNDSITSGSEFESEPETTAIESEVALDKSDLELAPIESASMDEFPMEAASAEDSNEFQPLKIRTAPRVASVSRSARGAGNFDTFKKRKVEMQTVEKRMAVMAPAEVETDLPPSQTTMTVFYATDRKSKFGIAPGDWLEVHLWALIALAVYLLTFVAVFASERKAFYGTVAFSSLVVFLVLGQSATVTWDKQKRLASNGDASYISEIRSSSADELLDYGTCKVTIPPDHKIGRLDSPSLFKLEFKEDPEKHVMLHRVVREDKQVFYDQLNDAIGQADRNQALVFVHGYNVSFENAVKRTAQIVHDLKFDGAPICYSWTSHGALANYTKDMANADATIIALQTFLEDTVRQTGNTTIHLVAHSMGNRALLQALDRIAVGSTRIDNKMFGQLVMAAPDVSVSDFRHRYVPSARKLAESITLYASSRDRALIASTEIHGHNRAGLAGENLVVMEGLDTIDVSEIDTSLIGHSYYGDHPELIKDLRALVELSQPAAKRSWLTRIIHPENFDYFRFADQEARSANDTGGNSSRR